MDRDYIHKLKFRILTGKYAWDYLCDRSNINCDKLILFKKNLFVSYC